MKKIIKTEYKIEVGEKIKIIDKWTDECIEFINYAGKMDKWLGKTLTVDYIGKYGKYKCVECKDENLGRGWFWCDCMIDWEETIKLNKIEVIYESKD